MKLQRALRFLLALALLGVWQGARCCIRCSTST